MQSTGEWGQFLSPRYAPHRYEESFATDFIEDIDREEQSRRGYRVGGELRIPEVCKAIDAATLPDNINDVDIDSLSGVAVRCSQSGEGYNFQKRELQFYRRQQIPLPRVHWRRSLLSMLKQRERMREEMGCVT